MHTLSTLPTSTRATRSWRALLSMALLAAGLSAPALSAPTSVLLKAQPQLIELSRTKPDSTVAVIVQKADQSDAAEKMLAQLGGRVTLSLGIINAFAAELPAKAVTALAQSGAVRWVSLDSEMEDSSWKGDSNQPGGAAPGGYQVAIDAGQGVGDGPAGYQVAITNTDGSANNGLNTMPLQTMPTLGTDQAGSQVVIPVVPDDAGTMTASGEIVPAQPLADDASMPTTDPNAARLRRNAYKDGDMWIDPANLRNVYNYAVRAGDAWNQGFTGSSIGVAIIDSGINTEFEDFTDAYWSSKVKATAAYHVDDHADMSCSGATGTAATVTFVNNSTRTANVFYRDASCNEQPYGQIAPNGGRATFGTYKNHMWVMRDVDTNAAMRTYKTAGSGTISFGYAPPTDAFGHGTHVAGIIAGTGRGYDGFSMAGTAPNADLIDVRVIKDDGSSRASNVVAGMQWVLQNKAKYNIRVVNISLNAAAYESYHTNPLCAAAEVLWFNGIVVVVSAGNRGGGNLFPPANDPFVITVGATDDKSTWTRTDDTLAPFSAYGVADGVSKPDLVAPGRFIIAPMAATTKLATDGRAKFVDQDYYKMSGTSMAAPIVSGAVAMLLEKEPNLTPDQVKHRLKNTATPFVSTSVAGAGLLDVYKALNTYTSASANTGSPMSKLLTGGTTKSWASVSWSSVSWSSVSWSSVSWSSVSWSSDYVEP